LIRQFSSNNSERLKTASKVPIPLVKGLVLKEDSKFADPNPPQPLPAPGQIAPATLPGRMPAYALLDNIRSVWNVGSMFRTADAVALGGLILCGMTATPPRADMEKTALGATLSVPWNYQPDSVTALQDLKSNGLKIIALEQSPRAVAWGDFACPFPHVFVVGHEVKGVQSEIMDLADLTVEIPMAGIKDSLNVAVSFGVMAFAVRSRWLARLQKGEQA